MYMYAGGDNVHVCAQVSTPLRIHVCICVQMIVYMCTSLCFSFQFGTTIQASGSGLTKIVTILPFFLVQNRTKVSV